jgi:hypothetical protein
MLQDHSSVNALVGGLRIPTLVTPATAPVPLPPVLNCHQISKGLLQVIRFLSPTVAFATPDASY